MKKSILLAFGITILFLGTCITPSIANNTMKKSTIPISDGNTLYVGGSGPGNYTKIQDAIDDANNGDTVFVYDDSSPYYESLEINKRISLIGENIETTIVDANYQANNIIIVSNDVKVKGFTFINDTFSGIYLLKSVGCSISGNKIISNNKDGIFMDNCNNNTIMGNNIISNNDNGIELYECSDNTITSNNISKNRWGGIELLKSDNNKISRNNIIFNKRYGINLRFSYNNTILKNNLIINKRNAFFISQYTYSNQWEQNYWNRPQILPKIIFGKKGYFGLTPWFNIDWRPAKEPYDI